MVNLGTGLENRMEMETELQHNSRRKNSVITMDSNFQMVTKREEDDNPYDLPFYAKDERLDPEPVDTSHNAKESPDSSSRAGRRKVIRRQKSRDDLFL
jgi:hypothetical protein